MALTSAQRSPLLPDVPPTAEAGLPGLDPPGWFGIVLPAKAPQAIVERLHQEIGVIAKSAQTAERFGQSGITVEYSTPEEFAGIIREDRLSRGKVAKESGVKIE